MGKAENSKKRKMENGRRVAVVRGGFVLWVLVSIGLSFVYLNSGDLDSLSVTSSRVELHGVYYFIGAVLCFYSFRYRGLGFVISAGMGVFLLGVMLEVAQIWVPYRTFNPMDMAGNGAGAGLFMVIWGIFIKK